MNDKPSRPANDETISESDDATIAEGDQTIVEDDATVSEADDRTVFEDEGEAGFGVELRRFRDYRVCEQLPATGGEADIYLTEQGGERYILKLYRKDIKPKEEVLSKAKDLSDNFPEHIIGIHEYGYDERISRWYEIQEYARYGSLKEHRDGKLNIKTVLVEISEALKVLHDHNILHLDLKPSNILIRETTPLDLIFTDFGVARALGMDQAKLDLSGVKGTLRYWSPEHMAKQVGREADYWSLGMIILELLLGYHPFEGFEDRVILRTLVTEGVAIPDSFDADHALLLKGLLTRVPKQRWGYEQIKQWLSGKRDIPVYYIYEQGTDERKYAKPYKFHEREYYTLEELMTAFVQDEESWEDAKAHLNRGWITKWLENSEDYDNHLKIEKIRAESASDPDLVLVRTIYTFNKTLSFFFNGKLITPQNLYLYVGKTIRKENTTGEGLIAYALVLGKLFGYYEEYLKLMGKEKDDLHRLLSSVPISFASSTEQQDKLKHIFTCFETGENLAESEIYSFWQEIEDIEFISAHAKEIRRNIRQFNLNQPPNMAVAQRYTASVFLHELKRIVDRSDQRIAASQFDNLETIRKNWQNYLVKKMKQIILDKVHFSQPENIKKIQKMGLPDFNNMTGLITFINTVSAIPQRADSTSPNVTNFHLNNCFELFKHNIETYTTLRPVNYQTLSQTFPAGVFFCIPRDY